MASARGATGVKDLHDRVVAELDRIPTGTGAAIYDQALNLLAEREPGRLRRHRRVRPSAEPALRRGLNPWRPRSLPGPAGPATDAGWSRAAAYRPKRASRASVSVPALLATRSLACGLGWRRRWVPVCGDRRWPGAGRHSGSAAMSTRSSAIRGCEPSAFITNTSPLHSAVAREGDPACRLAEPRLSGFAGQATLAWATF